MEENFSNRVNDVIKLSRDEAMRLIGEDLNLLNVWTQTIVIC